MARFAFISLSLAAMVAFVTADCPAVGQVVCETSDASPPVNECQNIASAAMAGAVTGCGQAYGSGCFSEGCVDGSCTAVVCQDDGTEPHCLASENLSCEGQYLQQLIDQCQSNGRIGGYVNVPDADGSGNYLNFEFTNC